MSTLDDKIKNGVSTEARKDTVHDIAGIASGPLCAIGKVMSAYPRLGALVGREMASDFTQYGKDLTREAKLQSKFFGTTLAGRISSIVDSAIVGLGAIGYGKLADWFIAEGDPKSQSYQAFVNFHEGLVAQLTEHPIATIATAVGVMVAGRALQGLYGANKALVQYDHNRMADIRRQAEASLSYQGGRQLSAGNGQAANVVEGKVSRR